MSDAPPPWDREMTIADVRRLAPKVRSLRARVALERKVAILERRASGDAGALDLATVPRTRAALRRWPDAERGLWQWAWPAVDSFTGPNAGLMARYKVALAAIRRAERTRRPATADELGERDRRIRLLERQNAQLVEDVRVLQRRLSEPRPERR